MERMEPFRLGTAWHFVLGQAGGRGRCGPDAAISVDARDANMQQARAHPTHTHPPPLPHSFFSALFAPSPPVSLYPPSHSVCTVAATCLCARLSFRRNVWAWDVSLTKHVNCAGPICDNHERFPLGPIQIALAPLRSPLPCPVRGNRRHGDVQQPAAGPGSVSFRRSRSLHGGKRSRCDRGSIFQLYGCILLLCTSYRRYLLAFLPSSTLSIHTYSGRLLHTKR